MKGFGTVVTGTLVAGTIRKEDELEVFPSWQTRAGARRASAWGSRGGSDRRAAHCAESRGRCGRRFVAGNGARAARDVPLDQADRRVAVAASVSQAFEGSRTSSFARLHVGDHRRSRALRRETSEARRKRVRATTHGGPSIVVAGRPLHSSAVFAGSDDWGRSGSGRHSAHASQEEKQSTVSENSGGRKSSPGP